MRYASVVITPRFRDSVESIVDDISTRSLPRAQKVDDEVDKKVGSLDDNARRGRMVPEVMDDTLRELLVVKNEYRLIYRVDDARSLVELLVLWPARKPLRLDEILDGE